MKSGLSLNTGENPNEKVNDENYKVKIPRSRKKNGDEGFCVVDFMLLFVRDHALMGKLVSTSFLRFILNITRHCTSGTGSKCREEAADRLSGAAFFPAINIAVGPFEPPG